jgi:predicted dehydrogenase
MSNDSTDGSYGLSAPESSGTVTAPALPYLPPRPRHYRPKIAVIGCGGISEYHLRAYAATELNVVALCNRTLARAEQRRDAFFPSAEVYSDYQEVLARREIEVVDITLPPRERVAVMEAALRAGKHVLSQKPFVLDLADGERLVALADHGGVKLAVNQNGRWAPHFSYLAAAVNAGLIGEIATVDCTVQWDHTWTAGTSFEDVHHLVLFDFGIHWFDLVARLFRGHSARRVYASVVRAPFQTIKPPMLAQVTIEYEHAQARLNFNGHVRFGQEDRTVICGRHGTLRSFGPSLSEQTATLHTAAGQATPMLEGTWFTHGFQGAMGELLCAIEDNREPEHSARGNLDALALCFAALASADLGVPQVPGTIRTASK